MHDKFEMLDAVIVILDKLADARGAEKCRLILDGVQRLAALKDGLCKEDTAHEAEMKMRDDQINALTRPPELRDGQTIVGGQKIHIGEDGRVNVINEPREGETECTN